MKLITRDTSYALQAVCYIAEKEKIVPVSELVSSLKMPRAFIRKILQALTKRKLLKSYKGQGGGFALNESLDKIYVVDLIRIFQGPIQLNECTFRGRACPKLKKCKLKKKIDKIQDYVIGFLGNITLSSLIDKE
jgi:Rrf2 family transcriptional regulator, iron-sulfur cluster assembly transcription factor